MADAKKKAPSVKVVNNRYKVKGSFHEATPNAPIINEKGKLCGVTNPRSMTYLHSYGKDAPFFEGIAKGILRGTRCDNPKCESKGSIYLPYRIFCPDCLKEMKIVDLTKVAKKTAKIHTFMITERTGAFNTLGIPIKFINIEIDGVVTILMSYVVAGEPEIGKRVVPVFRTKNPTYTITDLAWVLEGTPASKLPKGFTF
ncbi:MAG: hypothetical protein WCX65_01795 [bacterium]